MAISKDPSPLVIFGLDAGDPDLIERWARDGYLPSIASIMKEGCWGRTAGPEFISRHGIWLSLFSGISRSRHGYYAPRQLRPGTYEVQAVSAQDTTALPFWSYLSSRGKRIAIIDAPETPLIPNLSGIQLSEWNTHNSSTHASSQPPALLREIRQLFGPAMPTNEKPSRSYQEDRIIYYSLLKRIRNKGRLCQYLLQGNQYDVIVIVFSDTHAAAHRFWKYRNEVQSASSSALETELSNAIRDVYQAIDREFGLLLSQLPQRRNVFLLSSTGIQDGYPTSGLIQNFCLTLGYQVLARKSNSSGNRTVRFKRQSHALGKRLLPRFLREHLIAKQFRKSTHWKETVAFALPSFFTSLIRINLRGREPEGLIDGKAEYTALLDRLENDLKQLVEADSRRPAVRKVTRYVDLFGGEPSVFLPDLFVEWEPSAHFMDRIEHPRGMLLQHIPTFFRGSHHTDTGFFACAGPSIPSHGSTGNISLLDFAPTFLALMNEPIPPELTGNLIEFANANLR
jgi:predicted AlkP superfamily phosphohydrolase/phosphomutase